MGAQSLDDHRSLFDAFKCRMDVGNSPPEFSDRCLAARAPEAQLDGKQQVLVAVIAIVVKCKELEKKV